MAKGWSKGVSRKEFYAMHPKIEDEEVRHRGKKSTKSDAERFCSETIRSHGMFGCKARNDGRFFSDACPVGGNYGCPYTGLKKRHTVKTEGEESE